jgi:LPS-assembly protein
MGTLRTVKTVSMMGNGNGVPSSAGHAEYLYKTLLILALCFAFLPGFFVFPFSAESAANEEKLINISADTLEYLAGTTEYIADGSVQVIYNGTTLSADNIRFNNTTADALATGNVVYEDHEVMINADRIQLNMDTKLGVLYNSTIFYKKRNFHIQGGDLERLGDTSYAMDRADATTCDAEPREWHFKGEDIQIELKDKITARKATFYIREKPVLYSPYFWAPLARDRQTGFLTPTLGYSNTKGITYKQGFFWAMKDNMDATFYGDFFNDKGVGKGIDYRYMLTPENNGELWMYHLKDNDLKRDFFELKTYHNHELPYGMRGYLKVHLVNEFDYYTELKSTSYGRIGFSSLKTNPFGFSSEERLQKYLESNFQITKPFTGGRAYLLGQYRESLEGSSGSIPQTLPELGLIIYTRDIGLASFNMSATATNFWKDNGQQGKRIDVYPNFYVSMGRTVNFTQKIGIRGTLYYLEDPSDSTSRGIFDLRSIVSTRLLKRYPSFIHIIEPSVEYEYIPSVDQRGIPVFDSEDFIPQTSNIIYSFTNRLAGQALGGLEARFRLSNSYSLFDVEEPFSPVLLESTLTSQYLDLSANASYDVYDRNISETIASVNFKGRKGFIGFGKNFRRATRLDQYTFRAGIYRPLEIFGRSLPVDLSGKLLYDMKGGGIQELNLDSRYTRQCWGMGVSYTRRPFEYQIMFAVEFKGLGTIRMGRLEDFTS